MHVSLKRILIKLIYNDTFAYPVICRISKVIPCFSKAAPKCDKFALLLEDAGDSRWGRGDLLGAGDLLGGGDSPWGRGDLLGTGGFLGGGDILGGDDFLGFDDLLGGDDLLEGDDLLGDDLLVDAEPFLHGVASGTLLIGVGGGNLGTVGGSLLLEDDDFFEDFFEAGGDFGLAGREDFFMSVNHGLGAIVANLFVDFRVGGGGLGETFLFTAAFLFLEERYKNVFYIFLFFYLTFFVLRQVLFPSAISHSVLSHGISWASETRTSNQSYDPWEHHHRQAEKEWFWKGPWTSWGYLAPADYPSCSWNGNKKYYCMLI